MLTIHHGVLQGEMLRGKSICFGRSGLYSVSIFTIWWSNCFTSQISIPKLTSCSGIVWNNCPFLAWLTLYPPPYDSAFSKVCRNLNQNLAWPASWSDHISPSTCLAQVRAKVICWGPGVKTYLLLKLSVTRNDSGWSLDILNTFDIRHTSLLQKLKGYDIPGLNF